MDNFVNQLQELTKIAKEQQEKAYQIEQQAKRDRAIQDSNDFFNKYFSKLSLVQKQLQIQANK